MTQIKKKKKDQILVEFAAKVRNRRYALSLTQEQLAERGDFHVNYIGGIERAEKKPFISFFSCASKSIRMFFRGSTHQNLMFLCQKKIYLIH